MLVPMVMVLQVVVATVEWQHWTSSSLYITRHRAVEERTMQQSRAF